MFGSNMTISILLKEKNMKKYAVMMLQVVESEYVIEAENEQESLEKIKNREDDDWGVQVVHYERPSDIREVSR